MFSKNGGMSHRSLADQFGCGRTQIGKILKDREAQYQSNVPGNSKVRHVSEFEEVNKALYEWYVLASSKNTYPGGPELTAKAKQIAERLGKPDFKGSNGWLCKWKERYNIKEFTACGESGDVQGSTIDSWKERLPEIVSGYSKENIYNMDETGVFWRALYSKGFGEKGKSCKGGKQSKHRITVAFFAGVKAHIDLKISKSTLSERI